MGQIISASVGYQGTNNIKDLTIVLDLLNKLAGTPGGPATPITKPSFMKIRNAIREFQLHHFGVANSRIDPNNMTLHHLVKLATGTVPPGPIFAPPNVIKGMSNHLRETIVTIATREATRADRAQGVSPGGTRTQAGAARVKEYFRVFNQRFSDDEYLKGKPGGVGWCSLFATWVTNRALKQTGFINSLQFKMDDGIYSNAGNNGFNSKYNFHKDGNPKALVPMKSVGYSKGDICLVSEASVNEPWPTHHFIVAEDPRTSGGPFKTIEGNFPENGIGRKHSVTTFRRAVMNYPFLNVLQPTAM